MIRKQEDMLSDYARHHRRLLPKRMTPSKAVYDRPVAEIFVDGQSLAKILKMEGFKKYWWLISA